MLSYWIYLSQAKVPARSADDVLIFLQALNRNATHGITGYLHREDDIYAQYVEGPPSALAQLKSSIQKDRRHKVTRTLAKGRTKARFFKGWDMAFSQPGTMTFRSFALDRGIAPDIASTNAPDLLAFMCVSVAEGCARNVRDVFEPSLSIVTQDASGQIERAADQDPCAGGTRRDPGHGL